MEDKDAWKKDYEREYQRTTVRDVTIVVRGGWVRLQEPGGWPSGSYRKADIIRMTERLKTRPDMTANAVGKPTPD